MMDAEESDKVDAAVHGVEKDAMTGDRGAVIQLISCLRRYRQASKAVLDSRYSDGECDAVSLVLFEDACEEALKDLAAEGES